MKVFKKIMNAVAAVENCILVVSTLLILVLTVGNVFSRKVTIVPGPLLRNLWSQSLY